MSALQTYRLLLNEDCDHFVYTRTPDQLTAEGVGALVDTYAQGTQVTDLIFNVNASKSAIPSDVKQTLWDGYDTSRGDDQSYFAGTTEARDVLRRVNDHFLLLQQRGVDLYRRWIDRSRALGRRAWLSIRMNDLHNVDEVDHAFHDRFWKQHPEYWRVPWRAFEWPADRALDYRHPAVREHHLAYARECICTYDFDGLEVDWMRQPWCFAAGGEEAGLAISEAVMVELRQALDARARELGHPIELAARVPSRPDAALRFGFDPVRWARRGLVDIVIPSPDFGTTEFDMPIETWKQLLAGTDAQLAAGLEITLVPFPFAPFALHTPETARGAAAGLMARGADCLYLFNFMDGSTHMPMGTDALHALLGELGSLDTLAGKPRRHVLTFTSPRYAGEPYTAALPYRLGNYGFRPTAEFRLPTGPAPQPHQRAQVRLGLEAGEAPADVGTTVTAFGRQIRYGTGTVDPTLARELVVRVNGSSCTFDGQVHGDAPIGPTHAYSVADHALRTGDNVIEIRNHAKASISLIWVEIAIDDLR